MSGEIIPLLQLGIFLIMIIMVLLIVFYIYLMKPKNPKKPVQTETQIEDEEAEKKKVEQNYGKFTTNLTRESIFDFMEFDEIVDNMIVRKKGTQYIMVLQCNGVNYDV